MRFARLIIAPSLLLPAILTLACSSVQETTNAYTQARPAANEAATLMTLKQIASAEQSFLAQTGGYGTFDQLADANVLDGRFRGAQPVVNAYAFRMNVTPGTSAPAYSVNADPQPTANRPVTGTRHYFMDSTGAIHYNDSQPATASDPTQQ